MQGYQKALEWFDKQGWKPQNFQQKAWEAYMDGNSGLVNAPTGSGKTYSLVIPVLMEALDAEKTNHATIGIQLIWITPIRALAKEIQLSCERAIAGMGLSWRCEVRTGDTSTASRKSQLQNPPHVLIITPESLHVMLATKGYVSIFQHVKTIVVDEWHELVGSKRGVQTELFISRCLTIQPKLKIWGISATIGNLDEATDVLLYPIDHSRRKVIKADLEKNIILKSVIPDEMERFPWAGHLGLKLAARVVEIIHSSNSCLIFTNTRAQCEIWYQHLLDLDDTLAGQLAMHHGSISRDIREWVEEALYEGKIKGVVCTSSLDLGVDFRPVDTIIQIGSPKGVSRFIQRAGRSGHQPGADSHIWFVPTHALELAEAAGLRLAIQNKALEARIPYVRSFDVLIQYLMTLAVSDGFKPEVIFSEITATHCYAHISNDEWQRILNFLLYGSESLQAYDEYKKVEKDETGYYHVPDKRIALRHKLSIGTIVSDAMISIKLLKGSRLGSIEEWFVSQLNPGDTFWFAGRALELLRIKDMTAIVRLSSAKNGKIPAYMGGRMPLSSELSTVLQQKLTDYREGIIQDPEIMALVPIFEMQKARSVLPSKNEFLVEYFTSKEGYHLLMYPFEGRNVHEGMAALMARRLSYTTPISFSIAMNDLGFELLSDQPLNIDELINPELFSTKDLALDIQSSINSVEMARRKFRDIARISGLIFQGFPGRQKKERHIQASSQLMFEVFREYEPEHLLFMQTYDEVMTFQLEESRMRNTLKKIAESRIILSKPKKATPFSFPIIVDRLREKMSSEKLEDRIKRMTIELTK